MNTPDFQFIINKLNELPFDIRVEVLVADLIDNGMKEEDIVLQPVSVFKRRFGKDLHLAKTIFDKQDDEYLLLEITRDGIYDLLPEGVFHQARDRKHYKSTSDMVESVKTLRKEEAAARQFFMPIENEIFQFKTYLERAEKRLFYELENNESNDYLLSFWNLQKYKEYDTIAILVRFMPILYRLTPNLHYVKLCYEILLKQQINIDIQSNFDQKEVKMDNWNLGDEFLSYTTIIGQNIQSDLPEYNIIIGPLDDDEIANFLPSGHMYHYIQLLNSYFLPIGYERNIIIRSKNEKNIVDLDNNFLHLGINTILN